MDECHQDCHQCNHQILGRSRRGQLKEIFGRRRSLGPASKRGGGEGIGRVALGPRGVHAVTSEARRLPASVEQGALWPVDPKCAPALTTRYRQTQARGDIRRTASAKALQNPTALLWNPSIRLTLQTPIIRAVERIRDERIRVQLKGPKGPRGAIRFAKRHRI
jgi:hypothetical protein